VSSDAFGASRRSNGPITTAVRLIEKHELPSARITPAHSIVATQGLTDLGRLAGAVHGVRDSFGRLTSENLLIRFRSRTNRDYRCYVLS
jgi:hypothetical protein